MSRELCDASDEIITVKVKKGDVDAFGILFDRYISRINRYGRKFIGDDEDIRDAVQDIFMKAYQNILSFDDSRKFSTWIYQIAHNTFVNVIRKKKRERVDFFDFDTLITFERGYQDSPQDEQSLRETLESVDHSVKDLPAKYREVMVLYYFEEKNYKEISEILRIPVSTVGVRMKRARDLLKTSLAKHVT